MNPSEDQEERNNFHSDATTTDDNTIAQEKRAVLYQVTKTPGLFPHISDRWKNDQDVVLAALCAACRGVKWNSQCDKYRPIMACASNELKNNKKFFSAAIADLRGPIAPGILHYASLQVRSDPDVLLAAVQAPSTRYHPGGAMQYASDELKNDFDFVHKVITVHEDAAALEHASETLKDNKKLILAAVSRNGRTLQFASSRLLNDKEVVLVAVSSWNGHGALQYVSPALRNDKEIVLAAVSCNGSALKYASEERRGDKDIVLAAFGNNSLALKFASPNLQNNREFARMAVSDSHRGHGFEYLSESLKDDKEIVLAGIARDPTLLKLVSERLRDDKEVVMAAIASERKKRIQTNILRYASERLRGDKEILSTAIQDDSMASLGISQSWDMAAKHCKADKELLLAAIAASRRGEPFRDASTTLKNDKDVVMAALTKDSRALRYASESFKDDKNLVSMAVRQDPYALIEASTRLRNDKSIVLLAVSQNGNVVEYASSELKMDRDIAMAVANSTVSGGLASLSQDLQDDEEIVLIAVSRKGTMLQYASKRLQNDKGIVQTAVSQTGVALRYASGSLQNDKQVVMTSVTNSGVALSHASDILKNDRDVVFAAVTQHGEALQFASRALQGDKTAVLRATTENWTALRFASPQVLEDKRTILAIAAQNGDAIQYASSALRGDKDVVLAAVSSRPEALKFALKGLNQDRDCLVAAGIWDEEYSRSQAKVAKIVLSTRFSLDEGSTPTATQFTLLLKNHPSIRDGNFVVYSPNAFDKGTCDPEWTRLDWPCRGTFETCSKDASLKLGRPKERECCWRYSFRYQLEEAKRSGGLMIQVLEGRDGDDDDATRSSTALNTNSDNNTGRLKKDSGNVFGGLHSPYSHVLGKGQRIEEEMARSVGIRVIVARQPLAVLGPEPFTKQSVDKVVEEIMRYPSPWRHILAGKNLLEWSSSSSEEEEEETPLIRKEALERLRANF